MVKLLHKSVLVSGLLVLVGCVHASDGSANDGDEGPAKEWRFTVLLDDKEIGTHRFRVSDDGGRERVEIEASFDIRFLFFNAYSYRHTNVEQWESGCLQEIQSSTQAGSKEFRVAGSAQSTEFEVETLEDTFSLDTPCVKSFAYWNPALLESNRLLNAQTGDWLDVTIREAGREELDVLGTLVDSQKYELSLPDGTITLWYSLEGDWLALQAPAPGGRVLRYLPEHLPNRPDEYQRLASR